MIFDDKGLDKVISKVLADVPKDHEHAIILYGEASGGVAAVAVAVKVSDEWRVSAGATFAPNTPVAAGVEVVRSW